ncbi:hypothetical protein CKA32_000579 [Geitlerinema sp. FC II]|nr:hypothetical protein CKA32_000579 [Geitlerinema sp. FC II]
MKFLGISSPTKQSQTQFMNYQLSYGICFQYAGLQEVFTTEAQRTQRGAFRVEENQYLSPRLYSDSTLSGAVRPRTVARC